MLPYDRNPTMDKPQLEINYRQGKPVSAYLTLPRRSGDRADRTIPYGSLIVDYTADGRAIGIEIEQINSTVLPRLRSLLRDLNVKGIDAAELAPLAG